MDANGAIMGVGIKNGGEAWIGNTAVGDSS